MLFLAYLLFLAATVSAQELLGIRDPTGVKLWSTENTGAYVPCTLFTPSTTGTWNACGNRAQQDLNPIMVEPIYMFRMADEVAGTAMAPPDTLQFIWDDRGSLALTQVSIWRPICPSNYVSMGDLAYPAYSYDPPPSLLAEAGCFREDLMEACEFGSKIWDSAGSAGDLPVGVWSVAPIDVAMSQSGYYYMNQDPTMPPSVQPWCMPSGSFIDISQA